MRSICCGNPPEQYPRSELSNELPGRTPHQMKEAYRCHRHNKHMPTRSGSNQLWKDEDVEKLTKLYSRGLSVREIGQQMQRTLYSINSKLRKIGNREIVSRREWSAAEDEVLLRERHIRLHGCYTRVAALLPGRTPCAAACRWVRVLRHRESQRESTDVNDTELPPEQSGTKTGKPELSTREFFNENH